MTVFKSTLAAAALFVCATPAFANVQVLCAPQLADTSAARTIGQSVGGGSTSPIPSGSLYTLNGQGCTIAQQQDIPWFQSQGFTAGPPFGSITYTIPAAATGTTVYQIGTLPQYAYIQHVIVQNTSANAITGGLNLGYTSGGAQFISAEAVAADKIVFTPDATFVSRGYYSAAGASASVPLYVNAVTSWNTTGVTITVVYGYF